MPHFLTIPPDNWRKARELRKNLTPAERIMWHSIRRRALGAEFRRQYPIGPFIVDFVCLDKKLIVELDGGGHMESEQAKYDGERVGFLQARSFRIRRYFNNDILQNLDGVLQDIFVALNE
ncbi:MAG: DUF559 domain-containing protein [bacterium]|nr:DUF559 domain-containing protein [bacterium]